MTYVEFLSRKATAIVQQGRPIPADLFSQMLVAGIDISAVERTAKETADE